MYCVINKICYLRGLNAIDRFIDISAKVVTFCDFLLTLLYTKSSLIKNNNNNKNKTSLFYKEKDSSV